MEGYLVEFYLKDKKVHESINKSDDKSKAIKNAVGKADTNEFDSLKVYPVKLSYEIIKEE